MVRWLMVFWVLAATTAVAVAEDAKIARFETQELEKGLAVGYAVTLADVDNDGKQDIVVVDTDRVLWFQNPGKAGEAWKKHLIIQGGTLKDNVCIAAHDIDGDGKIDFALGAAWKPFAQQGTLQWLKRGKTLDEPWSIHPIDSEPTIHRIRFFDIDGDGKPELISVPLMGRGATPKNNFMDGRPVRVTAYAIPKDPVKDRWTPTVLDESLHVCHNFAPVPNANKRNSVLLTAYEGVFVLNPGKDAWNKVKIGTGNQDNPKGKRGASEIKQGRLKKDHTFVATVEPWHGDQIVVYTSPPGATKDAPTLMQRHVIDEQLRWGHAVWCADLDGDGGDELIVGVRDDPKANEKNVLRRGVRVYKATDERGTKWSRQIVDDGGMSCEDLVAGDLDGDGRIDIVAVGRFTHNVRIYWNRK